MVQPASEGLKDVSYAYDALNRVISETSNGRTHSYEYDKAGNRTKVTYGGSGRVVESTYDRTNRLLSMNEGGRWTSYEYDLAGNVTTTALPNEDFIYTSHDARNRATVISAEGLGGFLYNYALQYDAAGNLKQSSEFYASTGTLGNRTVTLSYDNANRLIAEQESGTAGNRLTTHGYDAANNRTSKTVSGPGAGSSAGSWTFTYNALNQLVSSTTPSGSFTYGYDLKGNRTSRAKAGGETTTYAYDSENRLKSVTGQYQGAALNLQYLYDYRGRRVQRTEASVATDVVFSGGTSVREWSSGGLATEYLRGSDMGGGVGGLLYSLRPGHPIGFTHFNHRGDVVAKTNGAGTLTWQATYEGFGTRRAEFGTTPDRQKANTKEEDPSGLVNEGHRYRDLETSVFMSKDPAGFVDGPNLYAYVRQNPWSAFDPEGLYSWKEFSQDADALLGGTVQGLAESNGASTANRPVNQPSLYRVGLAGGHALGLVQGHTETKIGSEMTKGGTRMVAAGGAATVGSATVASPVGVPTAVAGGALVVGGVAVTVHGTVVAANSLHLLAKDAADAFNKGQAANAGGNSPEPSAKQTTEESRGTAEGQRTHGNKLDDKPAEGYSLRDRSSGEVKKYGETTRGEDKFGVGDQKRYGKQFLKENDVDYVKETSGTKKEMHQWQHQKIIEHKMENGKRPELNKNDY